MSGMSCHGAGCSFCQIPRGVCCEHCDEYADHQPEESE